MRQGWLRRILCAAVVLLFCVSCGQCCGPGRGGGRRRSARRLTPLVFKQHVPNVAENTLGASGIIEGKISRDDPRFHDLVPNYNKDILFSDEEGTGEDRLMTERCKEKLNSLAIIVMNQWPGVRLRVTEAWDEGSLHAPNSLHYEGRAVDIATSDKDLSKHGMLARLAVQAGFDWVYYESRSRIHCSVKSESAHTRKLGGCFPGKAQVETGRGRIPIRMLQTGDDVKVLRQDGTITFSNVLMFLHEDASAIRSFLTLVTEQDDSISLTPSHLLIVLRQQDVITDGRTPTAEDIQRDGQVVLAGTVNPGDFLLVVRNNGSAIQLQKVVDIKTSWLEGVFAPLTSEGTVIVDDVVASCYAVIDSQQIAHWAFLPVRVYYQLKEVALKVLESVGAVTSETKGSTRTLNYIRDEWHHKSIEKNKIIASVSEREPIQIHWYPKVLYQLARWILPGHLVFS